MRATGVLVVLDSLSAARRGAAAACSKDLGREVTKRYDVKSGSNVFRFSFDE